MSSTAPPRAVAVAKPPGGVAKVSASVAKPAMAKPAVAKKLPASLAVPAPAPAPLSPRSEEGDVEVDGSSALSLVSPRVERESSVGLARPLGVSMKVAPNFAPKKAAAGAKPPASQVTSPPSSSKPAGAFGRPTNTSFGNPGGKKNASISTLRNRWEHTTSTAGNLLSEAKITMCEKKNLQSLLKLHRCNNVRVQSLIQEVIDNLVELPTGEICMEIKNGFRPLVDLTKFSEEDIQVWALWALANLAYHAPCQVAIIMEVGWHNIKSRYAASPLQEMKHATCLMLANLSHSEKNQQGIIEKGVPILMTFLKFSDSDTLPWALRALADITSIKAYGAKEIWDNELLEIILPYVLDDGNPELQGPSVQILANICEDDTINVAAKILASGAIDVLVGLLNSDNLEIAAHSARSLAHLGRRETGANEIKSAGGHSSLISLLESNNLFVQLNVATALNNLADFGDVAYAIKAEDAVEPLKEVILSTQSAAVEQQALECLAKLDEEALRYVSQKLLDAPKARNDGSALVIPTAKVSIGKNLENKKKEEEEAKRKASEELKEKEEAQRKSAAVSKALEEKKRLEKQKEEDEKRRAADLELYQTQKRAEEQRLAHEKRAAEEKRLAEEKKFAEERDYIAKEKKLIEEEKRLAEERRTEEQRLTDARRIEEQRLAEERRLQREADDEKLAQERKFAEEQRIAEEKRKAEEKRIAEEEQKLEEKRIADEKRLAKEKKQAEDDERRRTDARRKSDNEGDRAYRDDEERRIRRERLDREDEIERSRRDLMRLHDEEKAKLAEQKRQLEEEKMRLSLLHTQRTEEDRIRAQKVKMEQELEEQKKAILALQIEEERRKGESRLQEELSRLERQRKEFEEEKIRLKEHRNMNSADEKRMLEYRMNLEQELLEKSKKALEEERKLLEKLQRDREEEDRLRAERLKVEHTIEVQKLLADKKRLAQEREQMEDDLKAEKLKLERHREEMLADVERRKKEEIERLKRDKELESIMKNSTGAMFADEIRAMEERIRNDREALEQERKSLYAMKEDKFALDREKDGLERAKRQYEEDRKLKDEQDAIRRAQEMKEIQELRKRIEEDMQKAEEDRKKSKQAEEEWKAKLEEERLRIERDNRKLLEDDNKNNKSDEEKERIAMERQRLEEEKAHFAKEKEAYEASRRAQLLNENRGDEVRMMDLEALIKKEEEARQSAEAERTRLEEVKRAMEDETRKIGEHKDAIHSLLDQTGNIENEEEVDALREETVRLKRELDIAQIERGDQLPNIDGLDQIIDEEAEKRLQEDRKALEKENEMLSVQLLTKETELALREKKLRDAEQDVMRMLLKLDGRDSPTRGRGRNRSRSRDSSMSRSPSSSRNNGKRGRSGSPGDDESSISTRVSRVRRRRSTTPNAKNNRSRSRDSRADRSLTPTEDPTNRSETEDDRSSDSSVSRYTDSRMDDDPTDTQTATEFSQDDDDDDDDTDLTQSTDSQLVRSPNKRSGHLRNTPHLRGTPGSRTTPKNKNRKYDSESASNWSESVQEEDLKRSMLDMMKTPRSLYVDTPDGFDGGGIEEESDNESVEGLVESDPHSAARDLMKLLELDETRKLREPSLDSLQKFAKIRGGEPTQFEARDIVPVLLNVLNVYPDKSHQNIISLTLLILAILAYNKDINQLYIRRENGGQTLMDLLDFPINAIKARAALALASYSLNNALIKRECAPAIKKLLAILSENAADEQVKMSVCAALTSLADDNKENQQIILKKKGLKLVLQLTSSNQIPPKYALNLIAALAHKNKNIQNKIRSDYEGIFRKMVRLLSPYTKPKILEAAIHGLVELVRQNENNKKQVVKAGAVPFLVTILLSKNSQNPDIAGGALYLCWACAKYMPNKLANADFRNPKGGIAELMEPLKELHNDHVNKVITQIEKKLDKRRQTA